MSDMGDNNVTEGGQAMAMATVIDFAFAKNKVTARKRTRSESKQKKGGVKATRQKLEQALRYAGSKGTGTKKPAPPPEKAATPAPSKVLQHPAKKVRRNEILLRVPCEDFNEFMRTTPPGFLRNAIEVRWLNYRRGEQWLMRDAHGRSFFGPIEEE